MNGPKLEVFVYGTLKRGGRYWAEFCEGRVEASRPARIKGTLYDLHLGYPGARFDESGWIAGEILTFPDPSDLARLDFLEGYLPGRAEAENEYLRFEVEAFDPEGEPVGLVWAYEVTRSTLEKCGGTKLEDGSWPLSLE